MLLCLPPYSGSTENHSKVLARKASDKSRYKCAVKQDFNNIYYIQRLENVPADWADKVTLPPRFSTGTTAAIETGILTPRHRDEIVNSVAHIMLSYTIKPSGTEYHTICRRLVQQYPTLKDDKSETGYVSFVCMYYYTHTHTHTRILCLFVSTGYMEEEIK